MLFCNDHRDVSWNVTKENTTIRGNHRWIDEHRCFLCEGTHNTRKDSTRTGGDRITHRRRRRWQRVGFTFRCIVAVLRSRGGGLKIGTFMLWVGKDWSKRRTRWIRDCRRLDIFIVDGWVGSRGILQMRNKNFHKTPIECKVLVGRLNPLGTALHFHKQGPSVGDDVVGVQGVLVNLHQFHTGFGEKVLTHSCTIQRIVALTIADNAEECGHHLDQTHFRRVPQSRKRIDWYGEKTKKAEGVLLDDDLLIVAIICSKLENTQCFKTDAIAELNQLN
mmetsp:Transcript_44917/g.113182  ORF Transcript_44917/g.113182 Transcript_44917/m.113182 type:complete len:276 (-) Transcript_44917:163-990(-)